MADILLVGLLLVIIFLLITMVAPEILIYGTFAFCVIFLIVTTIVIFNAVMTDPVGSFWFAIDNNPMLLMFNAERDMLATIPYGVEMSSVQPDITSLRVVSVFSYLFGGCVVIVAIWKMGILDIIRNANGCLSTRRRAP